MKFLILILAVAPIYATGDAFGDLLGQEIEQYGIVHLRAKRQIHGQAQQVNYRPYSQAPSQIKQLLQAQQARDPIVHLPPQRPPQLGSSQPAQPQYQNQAQVSQYRPQVQYANAPQQPTYKSIPVAPAQYRPPAAAQRQYANAAANYPQQASQPNYSPVYKPAPIQQTGVAPQQYSQKLPPQLQQLLQIQANLPNTIPSGRSAAQQSKIFQPSQQRLY